jgi:hypothetical protein
VAGRLAAEGLRVGVIAVDWMRLEDAMTFLRSNADLALMAFGLGAGSLAYAAGAFVMGLGLHPPNQHGWSGVEMIAVGLYPLVWIGLTWGAVDLWNRSHRPSGTVRHVRAGATTRPAGR